MSEKAPEVVMVGGQEVTLVNNGVVTVFADMAVEVRVHCGNVYLSFATSSVDGKNTPSAELCARLRMPAVLWESVSKAVDQIMKDLAKPARKSN